MTIAWFKYHPLTVAMDNEAQRLFRDVVLSDLSQIRQYVGETAVVGHNDPTGIEEFIVAVNEAVANIIRHGYKDTSGDLLITIRTDANHVTVTLLDNGPAFDPTTVSNPDTTLPLAERPFGGLGVHMMREFCDEVSYRRTENNENELTLLKRINHRE